MALVINDVNIQYYHMVAVRPRMFGHNHFTSSDSSTAKAWISAPSYFRSSNLCNPYSMITHCHLQHCELFSALLTLRMRPLIVLLNTNVVGFGNSAPTGMDLICKGPRFISALVSTLFSIVHFTNIMCVSTWPLLW